MRTPAHSALRRTFWGKFALLAVALTLASAVLMGGIGYEAYSALIAQIKVDRIDLARRAIAGAVADTARQNLALARFIAELGPVKAAMRADRRIALEQFLAPAYAAVKSEFGISNMHFNDTRLITILRLHKPEMFGDDLSRFRPMLVEVNRTRSARSGIELGANGLPICGVVPVIDADGAFLGSLEVGSFITDDYLRKLSLPFVDFAVHLQKPDGSLQLFASGLHDDRRSLLPPEKLQAGMRGEPVVTAAVVGGRNIVMTGLPLLDYAGRTVGAIEAVIDVSLLQRSVNRIVSLAIVALLGLVTLSAASAVWLSRRITGPMRLITAATLDLAAGRDTAAIPATERDDEVGALARALHTFKDAIVARRHAEAARLELVQRLINVQEQERLRIARELHDQSGQELTGLSLGLKSLEGAVANDKARDTLRWLQSLTSTIGHNLHRAAWELRPTSLDDVGLFQALDTYISDWGKRFGIRTDFHGAHAQGSRFPPEVETTAYRLVQEALTNVLKHASAGMISVVVEHRDDWLIVIVEDDGKGFDPEAAAAQGRLGLAGMRERLALIEGTLTIESTPGVGTTLYFHLPVKAPARPAKDAAE